MKKMSSEKQKNIFNSDECKLLHIHEAISQAHKLQKTQTLKLFLYLEDETLVRLRLQYPHGQKTENV